MPSQQETSTKKTRSSNFVLVFEKQPIKTLYSVYKQSYSNVKLRFTTSDYTLVSSNISCMTLRRGMLERVAAYALKITTSNIII